MCHFAVPHLHIGVENTRFWTLSWEWAHLCHGTLGSAVHKDSRMHSNVKVKSCREREREQWVCFWASVLHSFHHCYITLLTSSPISSVLILLFIVRTNVNIILLRKELRGQKSRRRSLEREKEGLIVLVNAHLFYPRYPWQLCSTRMKIETFVSCLYIFSRGFNIQHSAPLLISNTERWQLGKLTAPKTHQ